MKRIYRTNSAWVALGFLALGMLLALGASPVAALPPTPATGFGESSRVSPVKEDPRYGPRCGRAPDLVPVEKLTRAREAFV